MGALTNEHPKCLVEVNGHSLLSMQIASIKAAGVEDIAIVTGYRSDLLQGYTDTYFHNGRWASSNMVESLSCADSWLSKDNCIVSYSDIFYTERAVSLLMNSKEQLAITYDPNWLELWQARFENPLSDAETFKIKGCFLSEIGAKPKTVEEVEGQYMGLLKFSPESWLQVKMLRNSLPLEKRDSLHMTGALSMLLTRNVDLNIEVIPYNGQWGEVDSQDDLTFYNRS